MGGCGAIADASACGAELDKRGEKRTESQSANMIRETIRINNDVLHGKGIGHKQEEIDSEKGRDELN